MKVPGEIRRLLIDERKKKEKEKNFLSLNCSAVTDELTLDTDTLRDAEASEGDGYFIFGWCTLDYLACTPFARKKNALN